METRENKIQKIEELLGSCGSREMAVKMLGIDDYENIIEMEEDEFWQLAADCDNDNE